MKRYSVAVLSTLALAGGALAVQAAAARSATLTLSPTSSAAGTSVTATGSGLDRRAAGTLTFGTTQMATSTTNPNGSFSTAFPAHAGSDYVGPEHHSMPSPCNSAYNWARASCWGTYEAGRLQQDIDYIGANRLGKFQRLWVSIDQLFSCFDPSAGFCGYDATALANVDAALHKFAAAGMQVDLVLLANGNQNGFHFEALDGTHATMRANYLTAARDFLTHIAADPLDVQAVAVVDLMNEAYYQSEVRDISDSVVHQWLIDLYDTAHAAAPNLLYTVSDTGRLYRDQATWVPMYPVDVYDIHSYDNDPEASRATYANAANLAKPWFVGEAGCGSGNTACTYGAGADVQAIDRWWLDNLRLYGAKAVLIEDKGTLFIRSDPTYHLRPVGAIVQTYNP